jgi:hypothetical protein
VVEVTREISCEFHEKGRKVRRTANIMCQYRYEKDIETNKKVIYQEEGSRIPTHVNVSCLKRQGTASRKMG